MAITKPIDFARRQFLKGMGVAAALPVAAGKESDQPAGHVRATKGKPPTGLQTQASKYSFVISARQPVVIVIPSGNEPLTRLGAERLAQYLERVTGVAPAIVTSDDLASAPSGKSAIVLAKEPIPYFRPDGYRIASEPGKNTIHITATGAAGLKYGCYRLIRELRQRGREVCVSPLELEANPWLKTREIFLAEIEWHPTPGEKKVWAELRKKFDWLNWDSSKLERYIDLVDSFGYNSAMLEPPELDVNYSGDFVTNAEADNKVETLLRRARHNGMGTSFFLWGQQGVKDVFENRNCPHDPEQAADIRAHYAKVIDRFGALLDRWMLHWADPGGCKLRGCTINTPQVLTNEFLEMLRQRGLQTALSFSLWALRWGDDERSTPWPGYEDWRSVVDSGVLSPEVAINLMRHYTYEIAQAIRAQNRQVGVWGWYMNDVETSPGMHVHAQILEREFRRLDRSAPALLDWYSLEDNNHILNLPLLYVGAQMLWDAQTSADQALLEFCDGLWGPEAAPNVRQALLALQQARCGPGEYFVREDLWPDDYMCNEGWGSPFPAQDVARCEAGLHALDDVKVDPGYVPKFALLVSPEELLGYIRSHLQYAKDYALVRLAYQEALRPAVQQGRFEETQRLMAVLPEMPDVIPDTYGAGAATFHCGLLRDFARTWKDRTFSDNLALHKKATASGWFNQGPRYTPANAVNGILCELDEEGWVADQTGPAWLKIDLGDVRTVRSVRIYNRGYKRDSWDDNLTATPTKADVFYTVEDPDPSKGTAAAGESGYKLLGGFADWAPTDDPGAFQEIRAKQPVQARLIKVVIYGAANAQPAGCGEVEVR
jgi:hypothetical protein